jgi:hypothetical protein
MTTRILTPAREQAPKFGREPLVYQHSLQHDRLFDDAGLAQLLDVYPRDKLGVYTMGDDPRDRHSWRRGTAGELDGAALLEATKKGRLWLNMRQANLHAPGYQDLCDRMFAELHQQTPGLSSFKHDMGVLISSPNAQVFYHLDIPLVTLWQLRGEKHVNIYPPHAPYVGDEDLERIALQETHEEFDFDPAWDQGAFSMTLKPGQMVTWPQNAPHRIVNGPMLNVSLSIEFMTPAAILRANVIYGNGVMRRRFNAPQKLRDGPTPQNLAKVGLARIAKAMKWHPANDKFLPVSFEVQPDAPNALRDLAA